MTGRDALVRRFLSRHPNDAARAIQNVDAGEAAALLGTIAPAAAARVLAHTGPDVAAGIVRAMPAGGITALLALFEPEVAAPILVRLAPETRDGFLSRAPALRAAELRRFMSYPDESAGRLMDRQAHVFRGDARAGAVESLLRASARRDDQIVLVTDDDGRLSGTLPITAVLLADPNARLDTLGVTPTPAVEALAHRDEVAELLTAHHLGTLPVVDLEGRPLGLLRHSALVEVAALDATADMQSMVGASREERALSSVSFAVRKRLPWLQINLATAFLAASVVGLFESTIAQFSVLAVLLPVVAGQSGNTGAQSLAVTMRGLTLREISLRNWLRVMIKESSVGLINGIAVAAVTAAGVYLWSGSAGLCLVIGLAMVLSMTVAAVAGAGVPLALDLAGQDPAQSSSIILTTVTDIVGFFSFLGLATTFAALLPT
jgi:magnesium transporter